MSSEMFEPEEQNIVGGLCCFSYWIISFVATKIFLYLVDMFGLAVIFLSMAVCLSGCFIFTLLMVPETKKKKEHDARNQE